MAVAIKIYKLKDSLNLAIQTKERITPKVSAVFDNISTLF